MRLLVTGGSGFIGTHVLASAEEQGWELLNVDIAPPREEGQRRWWRELDVLDRDGLVRVASEFAPTGLLHLAANTSTEKGVRLADYSANTTGTAHVLEVARRTASVERVLNVSTQFVCRPGTPPSTDETFDPHTVYGWGKVISEQLTRYAAIDATWTIARPTTIWGPHSPTHPARMVSALSRGVYFHPAKRCIRSYGYVKNVAFQLLRLLSAPPARVHQRVFYVGDRPVELGGWVDAFARPLTGRPARRLPLTLMRTMAQLGDVISALSGEPFLLQSTRLGSMIEDYPVPMDPIFELAGVPPYELERAVEETLAWLKVGARAG